MGESDKLQLRRSVQLGANLRNHLQEIVLRDLLGPASGPEEEVEENRVTDRYLVGLLSPRHRMLEAEESDELAEGGSDSSEEGVPETTALPAATMSPSSIGMTFCVDGDATALTVTSKWGWYERSESEFLVNDKGEPKRIWKRSPVENSTVIPLSPGPIEEWVPNKEEQPDVRVRGVIRKWDDEKGWTVTLFLINGQREPKKNRDSSWLFQPELMVEAPDGAPVFLRRGRIRDGEGLDPGVFAELKSLEMLYRLSPEFAVGHGVSVHAEVGTDNPTRAVRLQTRVVPKAEVPQTTPPSVEDIPALDDLVLDMKTLSETLDDGFQTHLGVLVSAYETWIAGERERLKVEVDAGVGLAPYEEVANAALERCEDARQRIATGIQLLSTNIEAAEAFRFANRAMWHQRIHALYSEQTRRGESLDLASIDVPKNRSWRPFQLAFILLNLPGLTRLDHPDRSEAATATADLLWFPTGGGKTEAYLGLTAYTIAIRRLQGDVGGRSGESGVAVLMRYTLRLLTLQQFQRATALICACEMIRREAWESGDKRWGETPIRIGLWVGMKTTPNRFDDSSEAIKNQRGHGYSTGIGDPAQLTYCPWCGSAIDRGKHLLADAGRRRTLMYCGDPLGQCPFSARKSAGEGLPVLVVDEEIYRLLPALLIGTVDKFAQLPWNGMVQTLFGQIDGVCPRHGFRSPDLEDAASHPRAGTLPAVQSRPHAPLRPPDLIIQDELHLISGPLGTLVGLYETAVDYLSTWEVDGKRVRPKVIASTATVRNASTQVHRLFARTVSVFPPHGLDARDNFFSIQRPPSEEYPGRLYIGICAHGKRLKIALIRVYLAYLSAAQKLFEENGDAADPWMTLVGYFNAMRELGGMRRLVDDDIRSRLNQMDKRGLKKRILYGIEELTSRKSSSDIPRILDRLETHFDPAIEARKRRKPAKGERDKLDRPYAPIDVLLATNMLSVGVDVNRLGLMVVAGQPKTTAEYIQATSRVGRMFPGVVCTVLNWSRPRDLSHYEQFEHYHGTFYQHVEALSVTPFASRAMDRGLAALLVACVRQSGLDYNSNPKAAELDRNSHAVTNAVQAISRRAWSAGSVEAKERAEQQLAGLLDHWQMRAQKTTGGVKLGYQTKNDGVTVGLLRQTGLGPWEPFTCLNSLRDVEPLVNLVLDDHGLDRESTYEMAPTPKEAGGEDDEPEDEEAIP